MLATKIRIGKDNCVRHHILAPYDLHVFVFGLFSKCDSGRDFIYKDKGFVKGYRTILVFSARYPKLPDFCEGETRDIPSQLFSFTMYRFSVCLNPIRKHGDKSLPVLGRESQGKWFLERSLQWGFSVEEGDLSVSGTDVQLIDTEKHHMVQQSVEFSGILQVRDSILFEKSVYQGLGHGKGFGFGLMEIVPIA